MNLLRRFFRRPQELLFRSILFQVHLWAGIILGLYVILVGVTGSILVFKAEAVESLIPSLPASARSGRPVDDPDLLIRNLAAAYPKDRIAVLRYPNPDSGEFRAIVIRRLPTSAKIIAVLDPRSGAVAGGVNLTGSWLGLVHNLHIFLLIESWGLVANGVGGAICLLLGVTGLVLWWPGVKRWTRALTIGFGRGWKRVNYDLHSAAGFWTFAWVFFWSASSIYFVWEKPLTAAIARVSPLTIAAFKRPPEFVPARPGARASLRRIVAAAAARRPGEQVVALMPASGAPPSGTPSSGLAPVTVFLSSEPGGSSDEIPEHATRVFYDPTGGRHLETRVPPPNRTLGDWLVWSLRPLHFGTEWGFAVKVLWAILGVSLPLLTVTGALMYWNRSLSKIVRRPRRRTPVAQQSSVKT